jgi:phosphoadenosine phosphosulfate reductase
MELQELSSRLSGKSIIESLKELGSIYPGEVVFTTSFGIEDQVITHYIFTNNLPVEVITLDTGRLFPETYKVFAETSRKYKKDIKVFFPEHEAVEKMVTTKGPYSFYESKENRMECCFVRKVVPLNRALKNKKVWITGIRAEQSGNRSGMTDLEWDETKKLFKYHPLFEWSLRDVEEYLRENDVPYNSLHDKGYLSIGCEPCTRPVGKGQDFRAGRWWWESDSTKECGCHVRYSESKAL